MGNIVLIRPGTVMVILVAAGVGIAIFGWASGALEATQDASNQQRRDSISCTTLDISFAAEKSNSTHHEILVQPNQDVAAIAVTFSDGENVTKIVRDVKAQRLARVTAKIDGVRSISATASGCSRRFHH